MSGVRSVAWAAAVVVVVVGVCCTPSHAHPGGSCEDQVVMCGRWAATGWCQTRHQYMLDNCPVSCNLCGGGSCEDQVVMCGRWAATGWCQTRHQYMLDNCPVSCNLCGDTECFDRSPYCGLWILHRTCQTQEMLTTCPHSCGVCYTDEPLQYLNIRRETITNPEFECGKGQPSSGSTDGGSGSRDGGGGTGGSQITTGGSTAGVTPAAAGSSAKNIMTKNTNKISVEDIFCGATPITDRFILTAAHCVIDPDRPVRTVRLGELDVAKDNEENSRPVDYEVKQIIVHHDFNPNSTVRYNDIALIQTVEKIAFNDVVFPYCLPAARPPPQTLVTGAGFGLVNATSRSSRLQEVELKLVDLGECESIYRREGHEPQLKVKYPQLLQNRDVMCAAYPERDACEGDSGGPLFLDKEGRRFLVGIVGSGVSCRGSEVSILPGLYISVSDHIDFIDSVVFGGFK